MSQPGYWRSGVGKIVYARLEIFAVGVHAAKSYFVAQDKTQIDLIAGTSSCREPPVTLTIASRPFLANTFIAGTNGARLRQLIGNDGALRCGLAFYVIERKATEYLVPPFALEKLTPIRIWTICSLIGTCRRRLQ